jgi:hypothetical protein
MGVFLCSDFFDLGNHASRHTHVIVVLFVEPVGLYNADEVSGISHHEPHSLALVDLRIDLVDFHPRATVTVRV